MKQIMIVDPIVNASKIPIPKQIPTLKSKKKWLAGIRLKKIGASIESPNNRFGVYLGIEVPSNKYCVGRYSLEEFNATDIDLVEAFDSLSELQHNWEID